MNTLNLLQKIIVFALPLLFAITLHEVAHGWVASKLGDPTAKMLGRLTINPLKHIDPVGTLLVPGLLLLLGGFIFGWAKPVPVTWQNLKKPKRDMLLVAAAGPFANLLMAILWALVLQLALILKNQGIAAGTPLGFMGYAGVAINVGLALLNLIPIPPLDGSRVLAGLLPGPAAYQLSRIEPYGFFILIILLSTGILTAILSPLIYTVSNLVYILIGLR